jgi:hypothetical protein
MVRIFPPNSPPGWPVPAVLGGEPWFVRNVPEKMTDLPDFPVKERVRWVYSRS